MSLADQYAEDAIAALILKLGARKPALCSLIRTAGRMLAESDGHEFAAQVHAGEVRRHEEKRTRLGADRRNRR